MAVGKVFSCPWASRNMKICSTVMSMLLTMLLFTYSCGVWTELVCNRQYYDTIFEDLTTKKWATGAHAWCLYICSNFCCLSLLHQSNCFNYEKPTGFDKRHFIPCLLKTNNPNKPYSNSKETASHQRCPGRNNATTRPVKRYNHTGRSVCWSRKKELVDAHHRRHHRWGGIVEWAQRQEEKMHMRSQLFLHVSLPVIHLSDHWTKSWSVFFP